MRDLIKTTLESVLIFILIVAIVAMLVLPFAMWPG